MIEPASLAALERVCREFVPFPHARSVLVHRPEIDIFKGIVGGYGKIRGAPAFIAFIGDMRAGSVQEEVGYTGEGIVLEATALGLDTCWVGGLFKPKSVALLIQLAPHEKVLAVTPVGYATASETMQERTMTGFGRTHTRLPAGKLIDGAEIEACPDWVKSSIEAARLAPSALNRQPWGFKIGTDEITVFVRTGGPESGISQRLDCGIAMLHLEVAAAACGVRGEWQFLSPPQVARFQRKDDSGQASA